MPDMQVKIYGLGWVGRACHQLFPEAWVHDPALGFTDERVADIAIVAVPTPLKDGTLDCSIVESVIREAEEPLFLLRSTVTPGFSDRMRSKYGKKIVFQPEYLGETAAHPLLNPTERQFLILGGHRGDCETIIALYQRVYNAGVRIRRVTAYEAEVIKLSENRAIAFKVAQCQELYDACKAANVEYNTIREAVYGDDPRFNLLWTFVYPEARGFNSKCIPKDVYGWAAWAESCGYEPSLTRSMLEINERYLKSDAVSNAVESQASA